MARGSRLPTLFMFENPLMHNGTHITSERRGRQKMGSGFKRPHSVADIFPRQQSVKITISRSGTDNSAEKVDVSLPSPFSATLHVNEAKNRAFFLLGSRRPAAILHWAPFQEITPSFPFSFFFFFISGGPMEGFSLPRSVPPEGTGGSFSSFSRPLP